MLNFDGLIQALFSLKGDVDSPEKLLSEKDIIETLSYYNQKSDDFINRLKSSNYDSQIEKVFSAVTMFYPISKELTKAVLNYYSENNRELFNEFAITDNYIPVRFAALPEKEKNIREKLFEENIKNMKKKLEEMESRQKKSIEKKDSLEQLVKSAEKQNSILIEKMNELKNEKKSIEKDASDNELKKYEKLKSEAEEKNRYNVQLIEKIMKERSGFSKSDENFKKIEDVFDTKLK